MGSLSPIHWIIVFAVILLLFGPARLAGVGKGLGEGIRSFKKGISEDPDEEKERQLSDKTEGKKPPEAKPPAEGAA